MTFHHHQQISPGGVVQSVQQLTLPRPISPTPALALEAGRFYFEHLRGFGRPWLRVEPQPDGGVHLRALGVLLLAFAAPVRTDATAVRYPISHGLGVQPGGEGRGYLEMSLHAGHVGLAVEGYHAWLVGTRRHPARKLAYLATQSALHVRLARSYLTALAARLT